MKNQIEYQTGDLFSAAASHRILVHACNCKGSWNPVIATQFQKRFPIAHKDYQTLCKKHGAALLGMGVMHKRMDSTETPVGYLFTSWHYGKNKDSIDKILTNTKKSVKCLLSVLPKDMEIHSPKINAGLFGVPWKLTEKVINEALQDYPNVKWVVWELE